MRRWIPWMVLLTSACVWTQPASPTPQLSPAATFPALLPEATASQVPTPALTEAAEVPSAVVLPDPSGVEWVQIAGGLVKPVDVQPAGQGRLLVVEQPGVILVLEEGGVRSTPFLDIRERVGDSANEQGLLGLALHPDFTANGRFFVNYTDNQGDTVIARFQAAPDSLLADPASEIVLLRIDQPYANHNGGGLAFGPDGYLYIGLGDGGSAGDPLGNAQSLNTLLGKILRLDVDQGEAYAIPSDNPYAHSGEVYREIWAYGLRNPWRFAFDPQIGDLYLGDVGQDAWEEINFLPRGAPGGVNFGWNLREGLHSYAGEAAGLVDPVAEYSHEWGCSVTGGVVVRDPALPEWNGVYLYGDYCTGRVWGLVRDATGGWQTAVLFETGLNISSFGQDAPGQVYIVDHGGGIYRLERRGP